MNSTCIFGIPADSRVLLCESAARDNNTGVSMGETNIGALVTVRHSSALVADVLERALDLLVAPPSGYALSLTVADSGSADIVLDGAGPVTSRHDVGDLVQALHQLRAGRPVVVGPCLTPVLALLTDRERQILGLIATGANNAAMATALDISPHTVRTHVQNLLGKLGADTRLAAAALARRAGLASTPAAGGAS